MAERIIQPATVEKVVAKPRATVSRESTQATIRRMALKHRRSLETLAAYDRGEIERPRVGRSPKA